MKNTKRIILGLIINTLTLASCQDQNTIDLNTNSIVVEGYLFADNPVDSFRITQAIAYSSTEDDIITLDELDVTLSDEENDFTLNSIGNGYYQNPDLIIESGKAYSLAFQKNDLTISAKTFIPEVKKVTISPAQISVERITAGTFSPPTQTEPIEVLWDNSEGDYYYVVIENMETNPEFINENFTNSENKFKTLTEPNITSTYNIDSRRDIQHFGTYRVIVFRVNPEYAALYTISGSTSTSIVEPSTNIENGLGIMTGISSDTVYFEVKEL